MNANPLDRRQFLQLLAAVGMPVGTAAERGSPASRADHTLRIRVATIEIAPGKYVTTPTYNSAFPGPLLRIRPGRRAILDVLNETDTAQRFAAQGLHLNGSGHHPPPQADLAPWSRRRYELPAAAQAVALYHAAGFAGTDLAAGQYGGQAGAVIVEPADSAGRFDREAVLVLKEFQPALHRMPGGLGLGHAVATINGRMLGHGDPLRVRLGQRVLLHVLNASASTTHRLSLPRHDFVLCALDGYPIPAPAVIPVLKIAPGERVSALVRMNQPGVWIMGEPCREARERGMGIVVEYAGRGGQALWEEPAARARWSIGKFAGLQGGPASSGHRTSRARRQPVEFLDLRLSHLDASRGGFRRWAINGIPHLEREARVTYSIRRGEVCRLRLTNTTEELQALCLPGQQFELTAPGGGESSGLLKDVLVVEPGARLECEFRPNRRGRSLLQSTRQFQRDFGLAAAIEIV